MGLFGKKEVKKEKSTIPELPKLPELPSLNPPMHKDPLPQLPSFPTNPTGEKFSQNAIKEAVKGGEKEEIEDFPANEFVLPNLESEEQVMQESSSNDSSKISPLSIRKKTDEKTGPVFVRIDKFENSLNLFEETKKKLNEMEKLLKDIKEIKEEEEKELSNWETEIQSIKDRIERVDKDIFSKVE